MAQFNDGGKWRKATGAAFDRVMKEGRTERRLQASERTMEKARDRSAKIRAVRQEKDSRAYRASVKKIIRDLGLGQGGKSWGRMFHVRVPKSPEQKGKAKQRRSIHPSSRRVGLPKYRKAIRDLKGRVAVFVQMSYLGLKSKGWRPGLAADHAKYCQREDALEEPDTQLAKPISNVAETPDECVAMWNAVEPVEQGYRANSKVQFRVVVGLPHQFTPQQRLDVLQDIGDQAFGRYGLGWMAFGHLPEAKGDIRNTHGHILSTLRPVVRLGDHEWAVGEEKLTEPFTPEGMKRMRAIITAVINRHCRKAGLEERYSHQTYQERGIDAFRTEKIGPARMASYEAGEDVALIERNHARIAANEASVEAQSLRVELELREALAAALKKVATIAESARRFLDLQKRVVAIQQLSERIGAKKRLATTKPQVELRDALEGIAQRAALMGSTKFRGPIRTGVREAISAIAERAEASVYGDANRLVKVAPRIANRLLRPAVLRIIAANQKLARVSPMKPSTAIGLRLRNGIEEIAGLATRATRVTPSRAAIRPNIRERIAEISATIGALRPTALQPPPRAIDTAGSRAFANRMLDQAALARADDAAKPIAAVREHPGIGPGQSRVEVARAPDLDRVEQKRKVPSVPPVQGPVGGQSVPPRVRKDELAEANDLVEKETRPLAVRVASFAATMGRKPTGLILGDDGVIYPLLARADSWGLSRADLATETARRELLPLYVEQELRLESLETEMKRHVEKPSELSESDMFCTEKLSKQAVETHDTYRHSWLMREAIQRVRREAWLRQDVESRKERMEKAGIDWRAHSQISRGLDQPGMIGRQRDDSFGL